MNSTTDNMEDYAEFLARKQNVAPAIGFDPGDTLPPFLKPFQRDIVRWACRRGRAAMFEGTGLGKAQPVDCPVLTPNGFKAIGEVKVGDMVIGSNGKPVCVTGVFPQGIRDAYRVTFTDGCSTRCDIDHLWFVKDKKQKFYGRTGKARTLREIIERGLTMGNGWKNFIPMTKPIEFIEKNLPVNPYLLGVLIGEVGIFKSSPMLSSADDDILERVATILPSGVSLKYSSGYDWRISGESKNNQWSKNPLTVALRDLGLHGKTSAHKFIPDLYKFSSIEQRLEILRGILDTDGHVRPRDNNVEFSSVSKKLAEDVAFIVQSLGGKAPIRLKQTKCQLSYRMSIALPPGINPFRLRRKSSIYKDRIKYIPSRAIASIENVGPSEMVCISVDAEDHLYVTEHCIVTHNTVQQLSWARAVAHETQDRVLVFAPLGVARQTVEEEAPKWGFTNIGYANDQKSASAQIVVTNYERLDNFDPSDFAGVVLDESGIIKDATGKTRIEITHACKDTFYKLCASATPAPNDWTELGTHAEFLGVMSEKEMLSMYFVHEGSVRADPNGEEWRLKRHAQTDFWRWVASWAVVIQNPNDLGYDEPGYSLPPLHLQQITVATESRPMAGMLFPMAAQTLQDRIAVRRDTVKERAEAAAKIIAENGPNDAWAVWCNLNDEADAIRSMVPDLVEVRGTDKPELKASRLLGFAHGNPRMILTKPKIASRGMNWFHCNKFVCVGLNDSFEQLFQLIRRFWRFGQEKDVHGWLVASELEGAVVANLRRKEEKYNAMMAAMVGHMRDLSSAEIRGGRQTASQYFPTQTMELPTWMRA